MRAIQKLVLAVAILTIVSVCFGMAQSLGDVARKQRQAQQATPPAKARKIVTDDDIPQRTEPNASDKAATEESPSPTSPPPSARRTGSAEQWKAMIQAQKQLVAKLQERVDVIKPTIRFVDPQAYWNGPEYNQFQRQRMAALEEMEKRLALEKKKLEQMQDEAHRAGFGNSVYE